MTVVGELALWVALFLSVWGTVAAYGGRALRRPELLSSGVRAVFAAAWMVGVASIGLWAALLRHDFSLEYVASHTTMNMPTLYLVTAMWGGTGGAVLSWALALGTCSAIAVAGARRRDGETLAWVVGALAGILAVVLALLCFAVNPYDRVEWVPQDGRGLAAHLQNPLAAPHFVANYSAYAAAAVALAIALAATVTRRVDATFSEALRRWSLAAWSLLTIAIALRMRWAYVEPALGGLWSWDPAESANVVLWLLGAGLVRMQATTGTASSPADAAGSRRAVEMYLVYLGLVVLLVGAAGRRGWTERSVRLKPGQAAELTDAFGRRWRFISQGASRDERVNYLSTGVALEAWRGAANAGIISAERRQYLDSVQRPTGEPAVEPGIRSSITEDVYVILAEVRGDTADLLVAFRPLVAYVWIGLGLVLAGVIATTSQSMLARVGSGGPRGARG